MLELVITDVLDPPPSFEMAIHPLMATTPPSSLISSTPTSLWLKFSRPKVEQLLLSLRALPYIPPLQKAHHICQMYELILLL